MSAYLLSSTSWLVSAIVVLATLSAVAETSLAADDDDVIGFAASAVTSGRTRRYRASRHGNVTAVADWVTTTTMTPTAETVVTTAAQSATDSRQLPLTTAAAEHDIRELSSNARCVNIPDNLTACRSLLGYRQMRTPDLLGLVISNSSSSTIRGFVAEWVETLLPPSAADVRRDRPEASSAPPACSPLAGLFVCSLLSPVCLERPVWPCRSLCHRVRRECSGEVPWLESINCDRLPTDDQLCIGLEASSDNDTSMGSLTAAYVGIRQSARTATKHRADVSNSVGTTNGAADRRHAAGQAPSIGNGMNFGNNSECAWR
jgi:hypothetical protein